LNNQLTYEMQTAISYLGISTGAGFLQEMNKWNQSGDDLRGVDAIAIAGSVPSAWACSPVVPWLDLYKDAQNCSMRTGGLVSPANASIGFSAFAYNQRTRILNGYCHDSKALQTLTLCPGGAGAMANITGHAHPSYRIIRSFLDGTDGWKSVGVSDNYVGGPPNLRPVNNVTSVFIDGLPAKVTFAGRAPGYQGLDQINVQVPADVHRGASVPVAVAVEDAPCPPNAGHSPGVPCGFVRCYPGTDPTTIQCALPPQQHHRLTPDQPKKRKPTMKHIALIIALLIATLTPAFGRGHHSSGSSGSDTHTYHRSRAARNAFQSAHPCPSTGRGYGACPGYVVDHVKPLACGGADAPSNMQWQTTAAGKAKDKWERIGCSK
jgi:hypothetical protein